MASLIRESGGAETEWLVDVATLRDENMWRLACKLIVIVVQLYIKLEHN